MRYRHTSGRSDDLVQVARSRPDQGCPTLGSRPRRRVQRVRGAVDPGRAAPALPGPHLGRQAAPRHPGAQSDAAARTRGAPPGAATRALVLGTGQPSRSARRRRTSSRRSWPGHVQAGLAQALTSTSISPKTPRPRIAHRRSTKLRRAMPARSSSPNWARASTTRERGLSGLGFQEDLARHARWRPARLLQMHVSRMLKAVMDHLTRPMCAVRRVDRR